ncbi:MAG: hypothetical protein WAN60_04260 [Candidatus Sulfotelmatobacter sp.]
MNDIEFVACKFPKVERLVIAVAEHQRYRMPSSQALGQFQSEKSVGVGFNRSLTRIVRDADFYAGKGQLFSGIGVLHGDGACDSQRLEMLTPKK